MTRYPCNQKDCPRKFHRKANFHDKKIVRKNHTERDSCRRQKRPSQYHNEPKFHDKAQLPNKHNASSSTTHTNKHVICNVMDTKEHIAAMKRSDTNTKYQSVTLHEVENLYDDDKADILIDPSEVQKIMGRNFGSIEEIDEDELMDDLEELDDNDIIHDSHHIQTRLSTYHRKPNIHGKITCGISERKTASSALSNALDFTKQHPLHQNCANGSSCFRTPLKDFRDTNISKKKAAVFAFHGHRDIYTGNKEGSFQDEDVDHVLECQMIRDVYDYCSIRNRGIKLAIKKTLRESVVNEVGNQLNVTNARLNRYIKGKAVTKWLCHFDDSPESFYDILIGYGASRKETANISKATIRAFDWVTSTFDDQVLKRCSQSSVVEGYELYLSRLHTLVHRMNPNFF